MAKDLIQIIRDNPGCLARIDNSSWVLYRIDPYLNPIRPDDEDALFDRAAADQWDVDNVLANDRDIKYLPGFGGYNWGGDVFQALADIVGIKLELV